MVQENHQEKVNTKGFQYAKLFYFISIFMEHPVALNWACLIQSLFDTRDQQTLARPHELHQGEWRRVEHTNQAKTDLCRK